MAKVYTAQEMREIASAIILPELATVADMLRQSADVMGREEKRKKNYEYGIMYCDDDGEVVEEERHCDWKKTVYWLAAATLTACVTY